MPRPSYVETHLYRFSVAPGTGSVAAVRRDDGAAEGLVVFDGPKALPIATSRTSTEWTDAETVAREAVAYAAEIEYRFKADPSWVKIITSKLKPGEYYPRIWRPHNRWAAPDYRALRTDSRVALAHLDTIAREVFSVVEPEHHMGSFGHRIRELLLLACMEVESSWSGILSENDALPKRATTSDYFKLRDPMQLDQRLLYLAEYPNIPPFQPFKGWRQDQATKTLPWYDAYNKTKHSRNANFHEATLGAALNALAAGWILHIMQFGPDTLETDSNTFELKHPPQFLPGEGYLCNILGATNTKVNYPFT